MGFIYKKKKIVKTEFIINEYNGLVIKPKIKDFDIDSVIIYNVEMIDTYVSKMFLNNYKKIIRLVLSISNDENPADDEIQDVLGEISRIEGIILNKYKKYISVEKTKKMLKELYLLDREVRKKVEFMLTNEKISNKSR